MMKNLLFWALAFCSHLAFCAEVPAATISSVSTWIVQVDVAVATTGIDPQGCGNSDVYRIDLVNDAGAKAKLSSILTAFATGKKVGLSIDGCLGDRPKIVGVRLYN